MDANDIFNSPEMKELMDKAKWLMLLSIINDYELSNPIGNGVSRPIYDFFEVFYDNGVKADIVVEAFEKLKPLQEQSKEDISSSDLTSFIKVLNDIQKKKGET